MSRKHYIQVAAAIRRERANCPPSDTPTISESTRRLAEAFASIFAADNPAFDRARFMEACGVQ